MFKLSLPVQRFIIGAVLLTIFIVVANDFIGDCWTWSDHAQDVILQSRTPAVSP